MKPNEELLYLRHILRHMDGDEYSLITSKRLPWVGWLLSLCYFTLLLQFYHQLGPTIFAILSSVGGAVIGSVFFWRICASKWPYVRPHMDRTSIERRLDEIES